MCFRFIKYLLWGEGLVENTENKKKLDGNLLHELVTIFFSQHISLRVRDYM